MATVSKDDRTAMSHQLVEEDGDSLVEKESKIQKKKKKKYDSSAELQDCKSYYIKFG